MAWAPCYLTMVPAPHRAAVALHQLCKLLLSQVTWCSMSQAVTEQAITMITLHLQST